MGVAYEYLIGYTYSMLKKILLYFLLPLVIMLGGVMVYHGLVVLELLDIIERMQNAQLSVSQSGGFTGPSVGANDDISEPEKESLQTVVQMDGGGAVFDLPHMILVGGGSQSIKLEGEILSIAKYVSTDILAYATVAVASCDGRTCGSLVHEVQINRSQAVLAIDVQFTNKNRIGSIAVDPGKQFRVLIGTDFYTPTALTKDGADYIEVPELGVYNATFIARVPKGTESFRLIFGEDIQNPTGLFDVDLANGKIEALGG